MRLHSARILSPHPSHTLRPAFARTLEPRGPLALRMVRASALAGPR
jgi:hypothetical protein